MPNEPYNDNLPVDLRSARHRVGDYTKHLLNEYSSSELMTSEELENRFMPAEKEAAVRRKAERLSNEFFTLVYLARHPDWTGQAIVVSRVNDAAVLLIPELAYEFKSRACSHAAMDEAMTVRPAIIDPPLLTARFTVVR